LFSFSSSDESVISRFLLSGDLFFSDGFELALLSSDIPPFAFVSYCLAVAPFGFAAKHGKHEKQLLFLLLFGGLPCAAEAASFVDEAKGCLSLLFAFSED